ncbi:MAG: glycosyltransferase family 25 protein, partial [Pseudomonadota bacterium]
FDRIYVINLPERTDRRAEIAKQLQLIGLDLDVGAVRRIDAVRPDAQGKWPSLGARGCYASHLQVLQEAAGDGLRSVLILEDDMNWSPTFLRDPDAALSALAAPEWGYVHGGSAEYTRDRRALSLVPIEPVAELLHSHFIAFRAPYIAEAAQFLEAMAAREPGDPCGGPMDVDGAYNWVRRAAAGMKARMFEPGIAYQRASRTDIDRLGWKDRWRGVAKVVAFLRQVRNRFRGA